MKFTKMQGIGNDYVYVNCFEEKVENPSEFAKKISNRNFGIGSDGLVLIMPSEKSDFRMRMFNPDGSESEMCGNATRCVGKYVYDNSMIKNTTVKIETLAGEKVLELNVKDGKVDSVKVDMGEPILKPEDIPVEMNLKKEKFISERIKVAGIDFGVTCVSMGNPHAVVYVGNVDGFAVEVFGPKIEVKEIFPKKVNAEFVQIIDRKILKMRVWERGTGETLACGTGACAVLVASVLNGYCERKATVKLTGGDLQIEWNEDDNHVYMTGAAVTVFTGDIVE